MNKPLYLPALDGLRFVAFLLVLIHHLPAPTTFPALNLIKEYGWVGVELFFVISSMLFFRLLVAEREKAGSIDVPRFYLRRLLRIYPLLAVFSLAMLLVFGSPDGEGWLRLLTTLLGIDNFTHWVAGDNLSIPYSGHLWTLSFELQIYAVIPVAFLAYQRLGVRRFLNVLIAIAAYCFAVRCLFVALDTPHKIIWVTPFLRPDSVLLGIALSVVRPSWNAAYSVLGAIVIGIILFATPDILHAPVGTTWSYPLAALFCASIVDATLRCRPLAAISSTPPARFLGSISYGLYVFHILAIALAGMMISSLGLPLDSTAGLLQYAGLLAVVLCTTVAFATISYFMVERPFLRLKSRFTFVHGRPPPRGADSESRHGHPAPLGSTEA